MKAHELLRLYRGGRRDFSGEIIRGQSFKNQNLIGIDLSYADIRGANFTNAILTEASLRYTKAGLQQRWKIVLVIGLLIFLTLSSVPLSLAVWWLPYYFLPQVIIPKYTILPGLFVLALFLIFFRIVLYQTLEVALGSIAGIGAFIVAGTAISGVIGTVEISLAIALTIVAAAVGVTSASLAGAAAVTAVRIVAGVTSSVLVVIFAALATGILSATSAKVIVSAKASVAAVTMMEAGWEDVSSFMAAFGGVLSIFLSSYISQKVLMGDEKYDLSRKLASVLAAIRGTSFRGTNLTDADFTQARLKSTDFRKAILIRTCWCNAQRLGWIRPGQSYLQYREVRQLVIKKEGEGKVFDNLNLQGINLEQASLRKASFAGCNLKEATFQYANLQEASFIGANLNKANLQDTNLRKTKLVQVQLDNANLRGANLTAAYIEDWGITTKTKLDGVQCEFVYMRLPHPDDLDQGVRRKPDDPNKDFGEGEFSDFIAPMVETLDIYHNQNIDPRLLAIALRALSKKHPEADIKLAAIEKKGEGNNILIRLSTSKQADHSKLGADYSNLYEEGKTLSSEEVTSLLGESGIPAQTFANLIALTTGKHEFYFPINNHYHLGDVNVTDNQQKFNITSNTIGNISGRDTTNHGLVNIGTINGNITDAINQLPASDQSDSLGLKEILSELQEAVSNESALSDKDKLKALEQLEKLAKAGQNPNDRNMKELADNSTTMLRGLTFNLPNVTKLAESCSKLLPIVSGIFGLN